MVVQQCVEGIGSSLELETHLVAVDGEDSEEAYGAPAGQLNLVEAGRASFADLSANVVSGKPTGTVIAASAIPDVTRR